MNHGTSTAYKRHGCRCEVCREGNAAAARRHRANRNERGDRYVRKDRDYAPRRPCGSCGKETRAKGPTPLCKGCSLTQRRSVYIQPDARLAIYERDDWTCGICCEAVESGLPNSSPWQATLDHIVPRSLGGTDEPKNLRIAHRYCNAVRSNRAALTLDELAA